MIAKPASTRIEAAVVTPEQRERFAPALNRVAGDVELLVSIAALVSEDAPEVFTSLQSQLSKRALSEVAALGHQLKGMLSTFETDGPVIILQELIHSARAGDQAEAERVLRRCNKELGDLIDEIKRLGDSSPS